MSEISQDYEKSGCTSVFPVLGAELLEPLHRLIFEETKHLLSDADAALPLAQAVQKPFAKEPTKEDFSKLMTRIDNSTELADLIACQAMQDAFRKVFNSSSVTAFPISRFRAQFPSLAKSTYNWHQDEGTWYAVPVKDLAGKLPATLWLSINGADQTNSIEIIPHSNKGKLEDHSFVEGQGYFNAELPPHVKGLPTRIVETDVGFGVAFDPLTFHRSVVGKGNRPRYSIDVRYYAEEAADKSYSVDWRFRFKRLFA